jgi:hypothetical protein
MAETAAGIEGERPLVAESSHWWHRVASGCFTLRFQSVNATLCWKTIVSKKCF